MNNDLIKDYIDTNPIKVVKNLDLVALKLEYDKIVQCQKRTEAKPEELVRAYLLTKLANDLGYSPDRIEIEHEYTAGRPHTITSRIDVIVRDAKVMHFCSSRSKIRKNMQQLTRIVLLKSSYLSWRLWKSRRT